MPHESVSAWCQGEKAGRIVIAPNGNVDFSEALLGFNGEALLYCQGISDVVAHDYATEYARMLQNRARGLDVEFPRIPTGLFEPNRNLIRSTLEKMSRKYFPAAGRKLGAELHRARDE